MKKIILILFVLIMTATGAFTIEIPDNVKKDAFYSEVFEKLKKDALSTEVSEKPRKDTLSSEVLDKSKKDTVSAEVLDKVKKDTLTYKISQINSLHDDKQKVKEWAKLNSAKYYVIINKKNCSATVYDKEGYEIKSFEVGIGKEIGDDFNDTRGLHGKPKNTTPAGEYTLITNIVNPSAYGDLTLSLGIKANKGQSAKKVVAMHKVPKFREKDRLKKFYDGNIANNRMSHGCINFLEKDFKELTKYIHGGLKTYVLPEEEGNELMLVKNDKNEFELAQTKY